MKDIFKWLASNGFIIILCFLILSIINGVVSIGNWQLGILNLITSCGVSLLIGYYNRK